jgi:NAD+ synthase
MSSANSGVTLRIDARAETERICAAIRNQIRSLKRRGALLGLSGGIDSSVAAALCARALGPERVLGLCMPERESSAESLRLGRLLGERLGIRVLVEEISDMLQASGCYERRNAAIRTVVLDYDDTWKSKIVLSTPRGGYNVFFVVTEAPDGAQRRVRLTAGAYLAIVAATNFKQRVRKTMEYHHADRLNYAVIGTPNRLEYDQGFFVKNGDGAADLKPLAHLYKTQVYQLADFLEIPDEIRQRRPTTDTYTLAQSQEEFYFSLPYETLDLCLLGPNDGVSPEELAPQVALTAGEVAEIYRGIAQKRATTRYLHEAPLLVDASLPSSLRPSADRRHTSRSTCCE